MSVSISERIPVHVCRFIGEETEMVYSRTPTHAVMSVPSRLAEIRVPNARARTLKTFLRQTLIPLNIINEEQATCVLRGIVFGETATLDGRVTAQHIPENFDGALPTNNAFIDFVSHISRSLVQRSRPCRASFVGHGVVVAYSNYSSESHITVTTRCGIHHKINVLPHVGLREVTLLALVDTGVVTEGCLDDILRSIIGRRPASESACVNESGVSITRLCE